MTMKRFLTIAVWTLVVVAAATAQSPEAIRRIIRENPRFAEPTTAVYQPVEGKIAPAPRGYKPFYFTITSRHGSRYELRDTTYQNSLDIYNRASQLGILTPLGEEIRKTLTEATAKQSGMGSELTSLGQHQLRGVGRRAYQNFHEVFESGAIEGKSSARHRCIFSMVAFVDGLKEKCPTMPVDMEGRQSYMPLLRPIADNPTSNEEVVNYSRHKARNGVVAERLKEWRNSSDVSAMLSKVTTNPELLVEKCGAHNHFLFAYNTHHLLLFAENFEMDTSDLIARTFTLDELYRFYVSKVGVWLQWTGGIGHYYNEAFISYMRPLVDDIINQAQAAIDGKNPYVANLRFTHDSYITPLLTIFGYKNHGLRYGEDLERAATSVPFCKFIHMGSNLQIILYRNKKGEVLVRSLVNERDVFLPIESPTAPFYKWEDMVPLIRVNMAKLDASREKVIKEMNNQ
ncbi:MAG: histidine-type phosphatase [Alistipes sp.]|nr:histidine-type phosphatase [Alistipes sp.]